MASKTQHDSDGHDAEGVAWPSVPSTTARTRKTGAAETGGGSDATAQPIAIEKEPTRSIDPAGVLDRAPLSRNTDAARLPEQHQGAWTLPSGTWDTYTPEQRRRWREWFDWAISPEGELWDAAAGDGHGAAHLANANLDKADLRHAKLAGANLRHAHLHGTNFMHADVRGTNFLFARLAGASMVLADARYAEFQGASMTQVQMGSIKADGASFRDAHLVRADFQRATLTSTNFDNAVLDDAKFSRAEMREASMVGASVQRGQLDSVSLEYAKLSGAALSGARLFSAKLKSADLSRAKLDNVDFEGACLDDAILHRVDLNQTDFGDATLFAARISDPTWWLDLPRATLSGTVFPGRIPQHPIQDVLGLPPVLRRRISDVQYLRDLHTRCGPVGRAAMWMWGLTCSFGQSLGRWAFCSSIALLLFTMIAMSLPFNIAARTVEGGHAVSGVAQPDFPQALYFSIVTFTTLGYGDLSPATNTGRMCVAVGVFAGYMLLGGLISILANKLARLS